MILRDIRITSNKNEESLVKFMLKVGIDGGGRFFKFCLNMVKRKTPFDIRSPPNERQAKAKKDGGNEKTLDNWNCTRHFRNIL